MSSTGQFDAYREQLSLLREELRGLAKGVLEEDKATFRLLIQLERDLQKAQEDISRLDRKLDHKLGNIKQVQEGFEQRVNEITANFVTTPIGIPADAPDPAYTGALIEESKARTETSKAQKGFWLVLTAAVSGGLTWLATWLASVFGKG